MVHYNKNNYIVNTSIKMLKKKQLAKYNEESMPLE